jgi:hypothetical protein
LRSFLFVGLALAGCAGPVDVTRVVTPDEAAHAKGTKLKPAAVVRGKARAPIPPETTFQGLEARVPRPGIFTYALDPDETVVRDGDLRIVGVKSGEHVTKFIPGTASLEGTEVHGELEDHVERVPLLSTDRVELRGRIAPDDPLPGGKAVATRYWSALIFGGVLVGGAWIPSVGVAATSNVDANHWLYLPVLGPWIAYATRAALSCATDPTPCLSDAGARVGLIADGILQTSGILLLILGLPTFTELRWGKDARLRIGPDLMLRGVF